MKKVIDLIDSEKLVFDFYADRSKVTDTEIYKINEFEDLCIEFQAKIDYEYRRKIGGDRDEILHCYFENSREIILLGVFLLGVEMQLDNNQKSIIESKIEKKTTFNLY